MSDEFSLGLHLKRQRESRGITLDQVASATKINLKLLQAIESDEYANLPAKPFVKGFISSYARFIGLDPNEILKTYSSFLNQKLEAVPSRESQFTGYAFEKKDDDRGRTMLWMVMGVFAIVGGIVILFVRPTLKHRRSHHAENLAELKSATVATPSNIPSLATPLPTNSPIPFTTVLPKEVEKNLINRGSTASQTPTPLKTPDATPSTEAAKNTAPNPTASPAAAKADPLRKGDDLTAKEIREKVSFKANENARIDYKTDEKEEMGFILRKGLSIVIKAKSEIRFSVAEPQNIEFRYRTNSFQPLENKGPFVIKGGKMLQSK